ncbi:MAG: ABC transporter permease, partial [Christensenellales bacterium]
MRRKLATIALAVGVCLIYLSAVGHFVVPAIYSFDVKIDTSAVSGADDKDAIARAVAGVDAQADIAEIADLPGMQPVYDRFGGYLDAERALLSAQEDEGAVRAQIDALSEGEDAAALEAALSDAGERAAEAGRAFTAARAAISEDAGLARLNARVKLGLATGAQRLDNLVRGVRLQLIIAGGALFIIGIALKIAARDRSARDARRAKYASAAGQAMRASGGIRIGRQKLLAPMALVILYVFFSIFGKNFFDSYTLKTVLESSYYVGILAFGVSFVIMTGGIDLSIGTNMMCAALIGGYAFGTWGWPLWLALAIVPLIGLLFGIGNGLMVAKLKLPPFIATLGTMLVTQGFGSIVTSVQTQRYPTIGTANEWFKTVFFRAGAFPIGAVYLFAVFLLAAFLLTKTKFGRYTLAIGSNEEAARLSGVKTDNWKVLVYAICGLFAGVAGVFYASTYTTITPGTGNGQELNAIAAVVIGGTSMAGGSGSMVGTLIGVFIMSVLKAGL